MKEEKLFEVMADIDDKYIAAAHKTAVERKVYGYHWRTFAAVFAAVLIICVLLLPNMKRANDITEPTADGGMSNGSVACATTLFYNGSTYISLVMPEELAKAGLPEVINQEICGAHLAYLTLGDSMADYTEAGAETDIELYECLLETEKEIMILRDHDNYWPVMETESDGTDLETMYSIAVYPEGCSEKDVEYAYIEDTYESEVFNEIGISAYVPSELPEGYHFRNAAEYVTAMKDDSIYKVVRITYCLGNEADALQNAISESEMQTNEAENEFVISIWNFKPDTSADIFTPEEVIENGLKPEESLIYVKYGEYFVGIEPLSLTESETIELIQHIAHKVK